MGANVSLNHLVILEKDGQIFAAGRELPTRRIKLFLIKEREGKVFSRNGEEWTEIFGQGRSDVIDTVYQAKFHRSVPIFKIAGAFNA